MNVVAEKEKPEVRVHRKVIPEDTDFKVVRFMNQEQKGVPLEFSAGPPISQNIRNYVLKDGLCYNLPKRLRDHINGLKYPRYADVEDPNSPVQGTKCSKIVGYDYRFVLVPEENPNVAVYEHLREKLNQKVMPGAVENSPKLHTANIKKSGDIISEKKQAEIVADNMELEEKVKKLISDNKDLVYTVNKLKGQIKDESLKT